MFGYIKLNNFKYYKHSEITRLSNIVNGGSKIEIVTSGNISIIAKIKHFVKKKVVRLCLKFLYKFNIVD